MMRCAPPHRPRQRNQCLNRYLPPHRVLLVRLCRREKYIRRIQLRNMRILHVKHIVPLLRNLHSQKVRKRLVWVPCGAAYGCVLPRQKKHWVQLERFRCNPQKDRHLYSKRNLPAPRRIRRFRPFRGILYLGQPNRLGHHGQVRFFQALDSQQLLILLQIRPVTTDQMQQVRAHRSPGVHLRGWIRYSRKRRF